MSRKKLRVFILLAIECFIYLYYTQKSASAVTCNPDATTEKLSKDLLTEIEKDEADLEKDLHPLKIKRDVYYDNWNPIEKRDIAKQIEKEADAFRVKREAGDNDLTNLEVKELEDPSSKLVTNENHRKNYDVTEHSNTPDKKGYYWYEWYEPATNNGQSTIKATESNGIVVIATPTVGGEEKKYTYDNNGRVTENQLEIIGFTYNVMYDSTKYTITAVNGNGETEIDTLMITPSFSTFTSYQDGSYSEPTTTKLSRPINTKTVIYEDAFSSLVTTSYTIHDFLNTSDAYGYSTYITTDPNGSTVTNTVTSMEVTLTDANNSVTTTSLTITGLGTVVTSTDFLGNPTVVTSVTQIIESTNQNGDVVTETILDNTNTLTTSVQTITRTDGNGNTVTETSTVTGQGPVIFPENITITVSSTTSSIRPTQNVFDTIEPTIREDDSLSSQTILKGSNDVIAPTKTVFDATETTTVIVTGEDGSTSTEIQTLVTNSNSIITTLDSSGDIITTFIREEDSTSSTQTLTAIGTSLITSSSEDTTITETDTILESDSTLIEIDSTDGTTSISNTDSSDASTEATTTSDTSSNTIITITTLQQDSTKTETLTSLSTTIVTSMIEDSTTLVTDTIYVSGTITVEIDPSSSIVSSSSSDISNNHPSSIGTNSPGNAVTDENGNTIQSSTEDADNDDSTGSGNEGDSSNNEESGNEDDSSNGTGNGNEDDSSNGTDNGNGDETSGDAGSTTESSINEDDSPNGTGTENGEDPSNNEGTENGDDLSNGTGSGNEDESSVDTSSTTESSTTEEIVSLDDSSSPGYVADTTTDNSGNTETESEASLDSVEMKELLEFQGNINDYGSALHVYGAEYNMTQDLYGKKKCPYNKNQLFVQRLQTEVKSTGFALLWDDKIKGLLMTDRYAKQLLKLSPDSGKWVKLSVYANHLEAIIPTNNSRIFVLVVNNNIVSFETGFAKDGIVVKYKKLLASFESAVGFGVARTDLTGRLWLAVRYEEFGDEKEKLYMICDGQAVVQETSFKRTGGMAWTKLYFYISDLDERIIYAYEYNDTSGNIQNPQKLIDFKEHKDFVGTPYDIAVDATGDLWVALFGSYEVIKISGINWEIQKRIILPHPYPVSLAFGDSDMDKLIISTAFEINPLKIPVIYAIGNTGSKGNEPTNISPDKIFGSSPMKIIIENADQQPPQSSSMLLPFIDCYVPSKILTVATVSKKSCAFSQKMPVIQKTQLKINTLGLSVHYDKKRGSIFLTDYFDPAVIKYKEASGNQITLSFKDVTSAAAVIPIKGESEKFLIAEDNRIVMLENKFKRSESLPVSFKSLIAQLNEPDPNIIFSTGKTDSKGRLWIGTISVATTKHKACKLYVLNKRALKEVARDITKIGGMAWSNEKKQFYLADMGEGLIYSYTYTERTASVKDRTVLYSLNGTKYENYTISDITVDSNNHLWVAIFGGYSVICMTKFGEIKHEITIPAKFPTSLEFGGKDRSLLYVATGRPGSAPCTVCNQANLFIISNLNVTAGRMANDPFVL